MDISLIVPCFNEETAIQTFFASAVDCFDASGLAYEIVFVDDGSADGTLAQLRRFVAEYEKRGSESGADPEAALRGSISVVSLSRNFGKEAAMLAGLKRARGEHVGFIDADMQQDPALSLSMLRYLQEHPDCDCVAAVQKKRKEGPFLAFFKRAFYRVFNAVGDTEIPADASDFRVFRRPVAEALLSMPEYFRFSKGLFAWVGFSTHTVEYEPRERLGGASAWSFRRLLAYALDGIMSFSTWPLKLTTYLGLLTSAAAVLYFLYVLWESVFQGAAIPGYPTLVCLILLLIGVLMLVLGIFGEYLGRIYLEGKHRPLYIERETFSTEEGAFSDDAPAGSEAR